MCSSSAATTAGATQVLFDASALRDAIIAAGRSVWGPDRPLLWVLLPQQEAAAADALRSRLVAAALARGLPIVIAPADSADTAAAPLAAARRAGGRGGAGRATAVRRSGITAVDAAGIEYRYALDRRPRSLRSMSATDALVQAARSLDSAPESEFTCRISGVADLPSFASVLSALRADPEVREVTVRVGGGR